MMPPFHGLRLLPLAVLVVLLAAQATLGRQIERAARGERAALVATDRALAQRVRAGDDGAVAARQASRDAVLPPPPPTWLARSASLGEARTAAYAAVLRVQTADAARGVGPEAIRVSDLDPQRVLDWLDHALALDPSTDYPLLLAARIHSEVHGLDGGRLVLQWLRARFAEDPARRWPWLAHGVYVARHVLHDVALAATLAADLREKAVGPTVPAWVRQVEPLLLADMGQLEAARTLIGALVASGAVRDASELALLSARLLDLERATPGGDAPGEPSHRSKGVSRE